MDELEETFGLLSMTDEPDTPAEARTDLRSSRNSHRVAPEPVQLPQASPETSSQEADNLLAKVYPNREQRNAVRRNLLPKLVQEAFEKQNELEKISWEDFMQNLLDTNGIDYKKNTGEKTKDKTKEKETGGHDKAGDAGDEEAPEWKNRTRNDERNERASRILSSKDVHKMEMMRIVHCPQVPFEVDSTDTIGRRLLGKRIADWMFFLIGDWRLAAVEGLLYGWLDIMAILGLEGHAEVYWGVISASLMAVWSVCVFSTFNPVLLREVAFNIMFWHALVSCTCGSVGWALLVDGTWKRATIIITIIPSLMMCFHDALPKRLRAIGIGLNVLALIWFSYALYSVSSLHDSPSNREIYVFVSRKPFTIAGTAGSFITSYLILLVKFLIHNIRSQDSLTILRGDVVSTKMPAKQGDDILNVAADHQTYRNLSEMQQKTLAHMNGTDGATAPWDVIKQTDDYVISTRPLICVDDNGEKKTVATYKIDTIFEGASMKFMFLYLLGIF